MLARVAATPCSASISASSVRTEMVSTAASSCPAALRGWRIGSSSGMNSVASRHRAIPQLDRGGLQRVGQLVVQVLVDDHLALRQSALDYLQQDFGGALLMRDVAFFGVAGDVRREHY